MLPSEKILRVLQDLPATYQAEVLDFVEYLKAKAAREASSEECRDRPDQTLYSEGICRRDDNKTEKHLTMVYWKGGQFWLGKLMEYPEIMTQGETVEELETNLKDAYRMMVMDDVPENHQTKEISV